MPARQHKVAVAMSGGVDSSVAAALLCQAGHDVTGITLRLPLYEANGEPPGAGCGAKAIEDASRVAEHLGIGHHVLDVRGAFERAVVQEFCDAYARGLTPNPCVMCNVRVKFGLLRDEARALGAEFLATGHYVRKGRDERTGRFTLTTGRAGHDQSYVLCRLRQEQIECALFPLGEYAKRDVRRMARELVPSVHDRPDSQDLCFVPQGHYRDFLRRRCPEAFRPGPMVHVTGRVLGEHRGIGAYTVGQRRGLGVAHPEPLYVVGLRPEQNAVVVAEREHLLKDEVLVDDVNWVSVPEPASPLSATVRIRYNHPGAAAEVTPARDGTVRVHFAEPQSSPTPGQAAVFYDGGLLLGGGTIAAEAGEVA